MALEERFDITVPEEDLEGIETVGARPRPSCSASSARTHERPRPSTTGGGPGWPSPAWA